MGTSSGKKNVVDEKNQETMKVDLETELIVRTCDSLNVMSSPRGPCSHSSSQAPILPSIDDILYPESQNGGKTIFALILS